MIWLRFFKNNRAGGVFGVVILAVALFLISFLSPEQPEDFSAMPFYRLVFGKIHTLPVLNRIITLIIMLGICLMLVRISFRYMLLEHRSYMPAYFFLLFSAALPSSHQVSPALIGSLFYILCFSMIFGVRDKKPDTFHIFNASLVLVLGSMFYLKLVWFIPLIWISLATLRPVSLREMFYPVIAYLILGLFLFTWYWVVLEDLERLAGLLRDNLAFQNSFHPYHYSVYLYYGFFLLLVAIASVYMANRFLTRKTAIQNIYQVMFYMFIAGILFFVMIAGWSYTALVYIAFPVSFLMADYFHRKRNPWTHELALWILLGLLVYAQIMV
ncbi:MAG: DUF6427 family protein [Bacteroidales bacterium]